MEPFNVYIQRKYDAVKGTPNVDWLTKEDFHADLMKKVPPELHVSVWVFYRFFYSNQYQAFPHPMLEKIIRKKLGE